MESSIRIIVLASKCLLGRDLLGRGPHACLNVTAGRHGAARRDQCCRIEEPVRRIQ
jgi:hypothetical protein